MDNSREAANASGPAISSNMNSQVQALIFSNSNALVNASQTIDNDAEDQKQKMQKLMNGDINIIQTLDLNITSSNVIQDHK